MKIMLLLAYAIISTAIITTSEFNYGVKIALFLFMSTMVSLSIKNK